MMDYLKGKRLLLQRQSRQNLLCTMVERGDKQDGGVGVGVSGRCDAALVTQFVNDDLYI